MTGLSAADIVAGFFAPWIIYAVMLGLHLLLPARTVDGYVRDEKTGALLRYRLNGLLVLVVLVIVWVILGATGALSWDWLYTHRWPGLIGSVVLGLIFSFAVVLSAPPTGRSLLADIYFGRTLNLQFVRRRVDAKMFLYLVGAVMLALNLLSFTAHHVLSFPDSYSPGVILYCVLFFWFVIDYLTFERVHLYTYDIFAERVGFKLGFGCLTFYPYFYAIGLWATAHLGDAGTPTWALVLFAVVFFAGWSLARGANMQKYTFKIQPEKAFLGFMRPQVLSDGINTLLAGGFWGVSRHVNYVGEVLMAVGLTLTLGRPGIWYAWLYPLYYVFLLTMRERADERRCAEKYGALWDEYVRKVPRRIVPWLY